MVKLLKTKFVTGLAALALSLMPVASKANEAKEGVQHTDYMAAGIGTILGPSSQGSAINPTLEFSIRKPLTENLGIVNDNALMLSYLIDGKLGLKSGLSLSVALPSSDSNVVGFYLGPGLMMLDKDIYGTLEAGIKWDIMEGDGFMIKVGSGVVFEGKNETSVFSSFVIGYRFE